MNNAVPALTSVQHSVSFYPGTMLFTKDEHLQAKSQPFSLKRMRKMHFFLPLGEQVLLILGR
jgi:hypothetical protein